MKKGIIYLILFIIILGSCKKENIRINCMDLAFSDVNFGIIITENPQFRSPSVNPNNSNELVYHHQFENTHKIIKYNTVTKVSTILVDNLNGVLPSKVYWGSNDKIIFDINYQVWTIQPNGNNLTQITNDEYFNLYPSIDNIGNIYWQRAENRGSYSHLMKKNVLNNTIDSLVYDTSFFIFSKNNISSTNKILAKTFIDNEAIISIDLNNNNDIVIVKDNVSDNNISRFCWSYDEQKIYYSNYNDGIYEFDIAIGEPTLIVEACESKRFSELSASPNGKYLYVERDNVTLKEENPYKGAPYHKKRIYKINLQTLEETEIDLF